MSTPPLEEMKAFALTLARQASQTVLAQRAAATVEIKPDGSPVTSVDRAVEQVLRQSIGRHYPAHGILGEEYGPENLDAEWVWAIDPIDGTSMFVAGLPTYGVLIALCHRERPVLGVICQPVLQDVYLGLTDGGAWLNGRPIASRPVPRLGEAMAIVSDPDSYDAATEPGYLALRRAAGQVVHDGSCLGYGALAEGRLQVCLSGNWMKPYDLLAQVAVVGGAGGKVTDWQGGPLGLHSGGPIVASAGAALHDEVLELLAGAGG